MTRDDLSALEDILARATAVIPMRDLAASREPHPEVIVMRHDVDNATNALDSARAMARWEAVRGYRTSYYFLHTAAYWGPRLIDATREIASLGHEIGFHNDALGAWVCGETDIIPHTRLYRDVEQLRRWSGEPVTGTAAHGNKKLTAMGHRNYQLFAEGTHGKQIRRLRKLGFKTIPLSSFGFEYQAEFLPRQWLMTDSGGDWDTYEAGSVIGEVYQHFPTNHQLTINQHPDHWPVELYS